MFINGIKGCQVLNIKRYIINQGNSIEKLKYLLKKSNIINHINAWLKSRLQERRARREHAFYCANARTRSLSVLEENVLVGALRKRLASRGLVPIAKKKGELHVFLAFALNNWESVLPKTLEPFGKVTPFEWRSLGFNDLSKDWLKQRDAMNIIMLETFRNVHKTQPIDAVVGYLSGYTIFPNTLIEMANSGVVIFNFCWDDKLYFRGKVFGGRWAGPAAIASAIDLNLTNAPNSRIKYAVEGGLAMFWPEAAYPEIHKSYNLPFEFDVSFVGGKYGWRPQFIQKLLNLGINVTCFGNGWDNGPLSEEEMIKLYSRSRINLGFAGVGYSKKLMCLKGRDFEVPMSGGLYLTQDNPELSLVYKIGKEIAAYKDERDCAKKIMWLLKNPDEAATIRKAGRKRALRDHTWEKRFEKIFRLAGIIGYK